jgi:regulator of sirC expression with transglutaminase-like and TPR domain
MIAQDKIRSMVSLLDDSDWEIYETVRNEIITQGDIALPILEEMWEQKGFDSVLQERLEHIISEIHQIDLEKRLIACKLPDTSLFDGLYAINRYQYPDIEYDDLYSQMEEMANTLRENIYPNARIKDKLAMVNEFFFNKWGFRGNKQNLSSPQNSFLTDVLNNRKGNPLLLCSIYYMLCDWIDIPVVAVNFPRYFILGVYNPATDTEDFPDYYLDVFGRGTILSEYDLNKFLVGINLSFEPSFLMPCSNLDIIKRCLNNLHHSYQLQGVSDKKEEIHRLRKLLE